MRIPASVPNLASQLTSSGRTWKGIICDLGAKYRRIASRRGPVKAIVAVQQRHTHGDLDMGTTGTLYDDPGADFNTQLHPAKAKHRAIEQLRRMGYHVSNRKAPATKVNLRVRGQRRT
jgi:hypothetical protein